MINIKCLNCGVELSSHNTKLTCCGCSNMTSLHGETISANDLALVIVLDSDVDKRKKSLFSRKDLEYQEARRQRRVRKLYFEER
jgi:hypothetical protein|tara:strand:- start:96 stop:347 length:252 start_codon:yes stop_codon:yes gene_type:complete